MPPPFGRPLDLAWWALRFSPRVGLLEDSVVLEVEASARLFGGRRALLERLRREAPAAGATGLGIAPTALAALALSRTLPAAPAGASLPATGCGAQRLQAVLDALPLHVLSATGPHRETLRHLGCTSLGSVRALPRAGLARRFGADLLDALDRCYGQRPETLPWVTLPASFNQRLAFQGRVEHAEGLMFGAQRLLRQLQAWLQTRHLGLCAWCLHWEYDLVRRDTPPQGQLALRTAQATRDVSHLARLLSEHLARQTLLGPVQAIRLEATETEPLSEASGSLLPGAQMAGEGLLACMERLSARLGPQAVRRGQLQADHRPERMQRWHAALECTETRSASRFRITLPTRTSWQPPWLLNKPVPLAVHQHRPQHHGPLTLLLGPERLDAGWWPQPSESPGRDGDACEPANADEGVALRDYYVASSRVAGLVWIYRQRGAQDRWFLHGVFG